MFEARLRAPWGVGREQLEEREEQLGKKIITFFNYLKTHICCHPVWTVFPNKDRN